mmetsp:Transcript_20013/g.41153  ORF Transcript_20013/g.41153 Transcript_20013/m.41153 type:complete len:124 (+) Transcript_20013:245-616(+)
MDPNPPPDLTQPSEARARILLDEGTGTTILVAGTGTILTPDPSVGTGHIWTPADFSPAQIQAMWDALAAIDGYSFRAGHGSPSEEPEQEPTLPELETNLPGTRTRQAPSWVFRSACRMVPQHR